MKILHTADWHLGYKTEGRDRLNEQKIVLDEIATIANDEDVDVVLVAGDVFHTSTPSSEAENLFLESLEKLSNNGNRVVVVIAGNHDDPKRLVASCHFAKKQNVVLVGDLKKYNIPTLADKRVYISETGEGYIKVKKENEETAIAILPFPIEYRITAKVESHDYSEQVKAWASICSKGFSKNTFNIFLSHLMVSSAVFKDNDDYFTARIGDVVTCDKNILPKAHYIALGHIHVPQFIGKAGNIYYPGSIIRMFYENESRKVAIIEGDKKGLKSHRIVELKTPCKMDKIKVYSPEDVDEKLRGYTENDIVELTFVSDEPISSLYIKELKNNYPCVLKVCFENLTDKKDDEEFVVNRRNLSYGDLFTKFYQKKKGKTPSEELTRLFLEIMEGDDETD